MPLQTGDMLQNRYRIVRLVGQGGFGAVYRAWDVNVSQPVALKENLGTDREAQRQFEREANLLAGLRHPNLPRVTDHFIVPGQGQYLVMDYIEGKSLAALLHERGRPLPEADSLSWACQVCDALSYLHGRTPPIIHRDIKPENVIIAADGRAMLVDFGISKVYQAGGHTTVGAMAVTPGYSPPEQYGGVGTDARSDVYALAATLYKLLTGQTPPDSIGVLAAGVRVPPARALNPGLRPQTAWAIEQAMAPQMSQRTPSAAAFAAALSAPAQPPPAAPPVEKYVVAETGRRPVSTLPAGYRIHQKTDIILIRIPAGLFLYGSADSEEPQRTIDLPEYWIGWSPVTNIQFARFVQATGRRTAAEIEGKGRGWTGSTWGWIGGADWRHPCGPQSTLDGKGDHPVVQVSWEDAKAYCDWAGLALPTEEQWEKAARGRDRRIWPWGNQSPAVEMVAYCNFNGNVGDTTPVGCYSPKGDSPYGCADMAGNVWEWTSSWYIAGSKRTLRGGSWINNDQTTSVSCRFYIDPHLRSNNVGFRVVELLANPG